jgi:hypothetical protein
VRSAPGNGWWSQDAVVGSDLARGSHLRDHQRILGFTITLRLGSLIAIVSAQTIRKPTVVKP